MIPADRSLTWLVTAPARVDAVGDSVDTQVQASDDSSSASDNHVNILVIQRDGFDSPYALQDPGWQVDLAPCPTHPAEEPIDEAFLYRVTLPPEYVSEFDTLLTASDSNGSGFQMQRANLGGMPQIRLVATESNGYEHASAWVAAQPGAALALAIAHPKPGQRVLLLDGAATPLSLPLPQDIGLVRVRSRAAQGGVCDQ